MSTSHVAIKPIKIIDGPNRDYLWDAVKYCEDENVSMPVKFTCVYETDATRQYEMELAVRGLEHEDGSGHSFNFTGVWNGIPVEGWYHAKFREGRIREHQPKR